MVLYGRFYTILICSGLNIDIFVVNSLNGAVEFIKSSEKHNYIYKKEQIKYKSITAGDEKYFYVNSYLEDFKDV